MRRWLGTVFVILDVLRPWVDWERDDGSPGHVPIPPGGGGGR